MSKVILFMVIEIDSKLRKRLESILEKVARDIDLEALAIFTREGRNVAFWSSERNVDPDLLSATSAALLAIGDQTIKKLDKGEIWEVIVRGSRGYAVMTKAGNELLLIGVGIHIVNLSMIVKILREAARKLGEILSS